MMNWNKTKVEWHGKMVTVIWVNCTSYTAEELYRTISDAMDANCYNVVTKKDTHLSLNYIPMMRNLQSHKRMKVKVMFAIL